ncbi:MAG TPA: hypothetical protein VKB24_09960 [Candidatus Acidoferrum sp.]|nr:hypothetical protein [Candidatus Acidoferrum sp.]
MTRDVIILEGADKFCATCGALLPRKHLFCEACARANPLPGRSTPVPPKEEPPNLEFEGEIHIR